MRKIVVDVERRNHQYDILFEPGLCQNWREEVEKRLPAASYLATVDAHVAPLLNLPPSGTVQGKWRYLWVQPGEHDKSFDQFHALLLQATEMELDRNTVMVAVGGGVTGDLSGFMASVLFRGVRIVMIPTTLLAQVDSSVGGKNGLNVPRGKNLIGTIYQPELVMIDPVFLDTLPRREFLAGLAEIVKTAILDSREFFFQLHESADQILQCNHTLLAGIIATCCRIKADVVAADEREKGKRALLNLGHTFGHALEALGGYDGSVVHGEAIAVGTALASAFAVRHNLLAEKDAHDIVALFERLELPVRIDQLGVTAATPSDWKQLMAGPHLNASLLTDKKADSGQITLILPHAIGNCHIHRGYTVEEVADFMRASL